MKFVKKTLVVFIAILLLVSCSGVFVMIHKCMQSKKTEIAFSENHKCCNKKKENSNPCRTQLKCCTVDYQYHKLTVVYLPCDEQVSTDLVFCELPHFNLKITPDYNSFQFKYHSPPFILQDVSVEFRQLLI